MRKILIYSILLFSFLPLASGQNSKSDFSSLRDTPKEQLYVHLNSSSFLVGEYMLFKLYVSESDSQKRSNISKVAYIVLVNKVGEIILNQTVDIQNGTGSGDFFLPVSLPSGNYKLIGFTNWMKNNDQNKYFDQDIFVINPYTSAQDIVASDSIEKKLKINVANNESEQIILNNKTYTTRDKISAKLDLPANGYYSVSVRQKNMLPGTPLMTANNFSNNFGQQSFSDTSAGHLPELRGKIIAGYLENKDGENRKLSNVNLAFSIPGEDYFFRIGSTNNKGEFFFSVDENYVDEEAVLQVVGPNKNYFKINLDSIELPDIQNLVFADYYINSSMKEDIVKRSVSNQIENAYFSLKPDTIKTINRENIFDGLTKIEYVLDDYTRFESVNETFVEIIPEARVRKNGDLLEFAVLGYEPYNNFQGSPLVVIDGLYLQDVDSFIRNYKSNKIESITVVRDKYFLGSMYFKGIIIIETMGSDFYQSYSNEHLKKLQIDSGSLDKSYYRQTYKVPAQNENIPDMRTQLLWIPNYHYKEGNHLEFYSSDLKGTFEISVQGFTETGEPISYYKTFEVN